MTKFLAPLDSSFLLLETPSTSMNIGAVIELGVSELSDPRERFEMIRRNIGARLHEIPVLTQRVVRAPLDLTWPVLVRDGRFDLDRHVVRVVLPSPGSPAQFDALVSEFYSRPLAPARPLWQLIVVEGLDHGRASMALKIHHALADGVSGAEIFANLFDVTPQVRPPAPVEVGDRDGVETVATPLDLLRHGLSKLRRDPPLAVSAAVAWGSRLYEVLRATASVVLAFARTRGHAGQPNIFEARRTSLNGAVEEEKTFCRARVALDDVKRVARHRGVSVTDVVLSVVSGALRRYFEDRGEIVRRDLIAFVPINVRGGGDTADLGNEISGMLVDLHTDVVDPDDRVRAISADALQIAGDQRRRRAKLFQDVPRVLGPVLISFGGRLVAKLQVFDRLPMANVMISSVPGPPVPLWLSGLRVVSAAPVGPLFGPFTLNITALGFEENLEFGLLGCTARVGDLSKLRDFVVDEVRSLVAATPE